MSRPRVPVRIEAEVLFRAGHTCCVCRTKGKEVQIHHIDGNPSNNTLDNLAVVCLDCHSRVTGTRGLGRSYSRVEVRKYKRSWDQQVQYSRHVHHPRITYRKELITQIDLIVCEILACPPRDSRVKVLLDMLYEIFLWRGNREITRKIIEGLNHMAVMSGIGTTPIAPLVAEKLWDMCSQYVGPETVPMDKQDTLEVLRCIDALNILAEYNCEFGRGKSAVQPIAGHAERFFEVGLWYSKKRIADTVLNRYEKALKSCYSSKRIVFGFGRTTLRKSVRKLQNLLSAQRPGWSKERIRLKKLLAI